MKTARLFALALLLVARPLSAATYVYVSQAPESAVKIYRMHEKEGTLEDVGAQTGVGGPGSLAISPHGQFLFASLRGATSLASFRIDAGTGLLKPISTTKLPPGANAAYVAPDQRGRFLFSASYSGGLAMVHGIDAEGRLSLEPLQKIETAKSAHAAVVDAANRFVFVPHVAPNAIYQFRLDAETGRLTPMEKAPGGTEKAGPRHLAIHPRQKYAFSSDESGSSVTVYSLDAQHGLKPVQTESTLPAEYDGRNSTADVKMHPTGKFVWVSNRGHDSLAGYRFNETAGRVEPLGQTPTEKTPRSFDVEPTGRFLYSAGEGSGKLAVFRIDAESGQLTRIQTVDVGKSLSWVLTVKL